jgi:DNA-3-methyladenine glycosylase I
MEYKTIFENVEKTLLIEGSKNIPLEQVQERLNVFKQVEGRIFSDAEYYRILVDVIFYSGFLASTVNAKLDTIHKHFPDFESVSGYGEKEVDVILADESMIRNRRKIKACIENARLFKKIIRDHGSFQEYIESFNAKDSLEGFLSLKNELEGNFRGLGSITVYHFLTDTGFFVLKPDRVICRIFERLGLIENKKQIYQAVLQGRNFSKATGHPIRYIDIVFVAYGQVKSNEFGIERGICMEDNPSCQLCGVQKYCAYYQDTYRN